VYNKSRCTRISGDENRQEAYPDKLEVAYTCDGWIWVVFYLKWVKNGIESSATDETGEIS